MENKTQNYEQMPKKSNKATPFFFYKRLFILGQCPVRFVFQ